MMVIESLMRMYVININLCMNKLIQAHVAHDAFSFLEFKLVRHQSFKLLELIHFHNFLSSYKILG